MALPLALRPPARVAVLGTLLPLFSLTSAVGGLGPAELLIALAVTLPPSAALVRTATAIRRARPHANVRLRAGQAAAPAASRS